MTQNNHYLTQSDGIWHIRLRAPKSWNYSKERFVCSLATDDIKTARKLRDRYLSPILAETNAIDMLNEISRIINNGNERICAMRQDMEANLCPQKSLTIIELFAERVNFLKASGTAEATVRNYQEAADAFAIILDGFPLDKLTLKEMRVCRNKFQKLPKNWRRSGKLIAQKNEDLLATSTIKNRFKSFEATWNWAISEGFLDCPFPAPDLRIRKRADEKKQSQPITETECEKLLELPYPRTKSCTTDEWRLIPLIAKFTGLRLAEIAQLTTDDIITCQGILCLDINDNNGKALKTENSRRTLPISNKLLPYLQGFIEGQEGPLFNINGSRPGKAFGDLFNRKAKTIGNHIHFHSFRSYFITALANAGVAQTDRMRLAGHKSSVHGAYTADDMHRFKKAVDSIL